MFGVNMTFISSSEVKKCIFHECRRQEWNIHFFTSLDEIKVIFTPNIWIFFLFLDLERRNVEERTESKCRKDKDHDLRHGTGPPAEFRGVSRRRPSHWGGQQQHLLQWLQALGAQCSRLKRLKKDPDYKCTRCQGTARPLDGRPQKEVQVDLTSLRW